MMKQVVLENNSIKLPFNQLMNIFEPSLKRSHKKILIPLLSNIEED